MVKRTVSNLPVRILILVSVLPVLHYFVTGVLFSFDIPTADQWRWINLLVAYEHGEITFIDFVRHDFSPLGHSHILTMLSLYINYQLFDLRFNYESYFGIACYIASGGLFLYAFYKTYEYDGNNLILSCYILALSLIYFCIHSLSVFTWSLLSFESLYWLMTLILVIGFNRYLIKTSRPGILFCWCVIILFFGDGMGIVGLFTSLVVGMLHVKLFERAKWYVLMLILIITLGVVLQYWLFSPFQHLEDSRQSALEYFVSNPGHVVEFIVNAYAQSIVDLNKPFLFTGNTQFVLQKSIGIIALVLNICCFIVYFRNKVYMRTTIPLFLILFSAISIFGILFSRLPDHGPEYAFAHRYIRLFIIGFLGCIWIIADSQLVGYKKHHIYHQQLLNTIPLLAISLFIYLFSAVFVWKTSNSHYLTNQIKANEIYQSTKDSNYVMGEQNRRCLDHYCDRGINFLKNNKLSLFRLEK
jgi:hypothetical protein